MDYKIKLDVRKGVSANAEDYYESAKKAKDKIEGVKKALADTDAKIKDLMDKQALEAERMAAPVARKNKEKKWFDKYHNFISSDGFLVVGGKDATTNEILIKKNLEDNDLVFHADIHGAPFFVIKNPEKKEIPERTINEAAEAGAAYSKAWKLGLGSVDIYHVLPEQVSKTAPSGEYVGKGGFMISGKKNYHRGVKLVAAIGVVIGEEIVVVSGPVSSVESKTQYFVKVMPGDDKPGEMAKTIKAKIVGKAKKEDAEAIKKMNVDLFLQAVPGGKGRVGN